MEAGADDATSFFEQGPPSACCDDAARQASTWRSNARVPFWLTRRVAVAGFPVRTGVAIAGSSGVWAYLCTEEPLRACAYRRGCDAERGPVVSDPDNESACRLRNVWVRDEVLGRSVPWNAAELLLAVEPRCRLKSAVCVSLTTSARALAARRPPSACKRCCWRRWYRVLVLTSLGRAAADTFCAVAFVWSFCTGQSRCNRSRCAGAAPLLPGAVPLTSAGFSFHL